MHGNISYWFFFVYAQVWGSSTFHHGSIIVGQSSKVSRMIKINTWETVALYKLTVFLLSQIFLGRGMNHFVCGGIETTSRSSASEPIARRETFSQGNIKLFDLVKGHEGDNLCKRFHSLTTKARMGCVSDMNGRDQPRKVRPSIRLNTSLGPLKNHPKTISLLHLFSDSCFFHSSQGFQGWQ